MRADFEFNHSEFDRLQENISRLGDKAEETMNKSLAERVEEAIVPRITSLIPISRNPNGRGIRDKVHARNLVWHKKELGNLSVTIKSRGGAANKRGSLGYLVFPDEGRGSSNPVAHEFMARGLDEGTPDLVDGLEEDLIKRIEEEL